MSEFFSLLEEMQNQDNGLLGCSSLYLIYNDYNAIECLFIFNKFF